MCSQMWWLKIVCVQLSHKKNDGSMLEDIPRHSHIEPRPDEDTPAITLYAFVKWHEIFYRKRTHPPMIGLLPITLKDADKLLGL